MSLTSTLAATAALAVGSVGAVTAYQIVAPEPVSETGEQTAAAAAQQPAQRGFAPCRPPAKLEAGKCVTDVTRTVAVPATAQEPAPEQEAPAPPAARSRTQGAHPRATLAAVLEECDPDDVEDMHEAEGEAEDEDEARHHGDDGDHGGDSCVEDAREEAAERAEDAAEETAERAEERAEAREEQAERDDD